jgi:branched-chain amino acid transport system permease protein
MSTLAAQFILIWIILHIPNLTGGIHGLAAPKPRIWGLNFNTHQSFYFIVMFFVVLFTFFAKNLARSKIGRAFVAIRDNDIAADVMGINLTFYKLLAFLICSLYAGVAGALWAHYVGYISVEHFTLMNSIWYLGMLIIGGMGTAVGPIFGAIFLRLAEQFTMWASPMIAETFPLLATTVASGLGQVLFGIVIILFLVFEPRGLAHTWGLFKNYYRLWPFPY